MDRVNYFIVVIAPLFVCFMSYCKQLLLALFKPASEYGDEPEEEEEEDTTPKKKWWKKKKVEEKDEG